MWSITSTSEMGAPPHCSASLSDNNNSHIQPEVSKGFTFNRQSLEVNSQITGFEIDTEDTADPAQSLSHKFFNDQEVSNGSLSIGQSSEVHSEITGHEVEREETNNSMQSLTQNLSCIPTDNEKPFKISMDEDSHKLLDNVYEESSSKDEPCIISVDERKGGEVAPEAIESYQQDNGSLKLLTEKLSAALQNVSLKDELVKQHSKVAEEAVAGWEKAEKEVDALKQQLEVEVQSKSTLEAHVSQLDEALKECVRQLRLGRDDQERKINQAVAKRTNELELSKTKLQDQLVELQTLVETFRAQSPDPKLQQKLEFLESENTTLRQELQSQWESLEIRTIERDLSAKAAETASKQHLESINQVAKLEAECRKLRSLSRLTSTINDHRVTVAASSYAESLSDCQSDGAEHVSASEMDCRKVNGWGPYECNPRRSGSWASALVAELDQFKSEKVLDRNLHSSKEINLMDDFLEMERLAALPDSSPRYSVCNDQTYEKPASETESNLRAEVESLAHRTAELEDYIRKMEEERAELEMALSQTQSCLENSEVQLVESLIKVEQLEMDLQGANEGELFHTNVVDCLHREIELMSPQMKSLRAEIGRERVLSEEMSSRCEELEKQLKKAEELKMHRDALYSEDLRRNEIALAEAQDCLEKSRAQLKQTEMKLKELEIELHKANEEKKSLNSELDSMRAEVQAMSTQDCFEKSIAELKQTEIKLKELEIELLKANEEKQSLNLELDSERANVRTMLTQDCWEKSQTHLKQTEMKLEELEKELHEANEEKKSLNLQLDCLRAEAQTMLNQIGSLEQQVQKEKTLAAQLSTEVRELQMDLGQTRQELFAHQRAHSNNEIKLKQEDLAMAAGKLADCQKTIASLGSQLKSLATLEDFLIDTASIPGFSPPDPLMTRRAFEPWKLHSNDTFLPQKGLEPLSPTREGFSPYASLSARECRELPASSLPSTSSDFFLNPPSSEKSSNGFAKYFSLSRQ